MRILVTGASGFVGGRFLARFRAEPGLEIRGIARRPIADPSCACVDLSRPFDLDWLPDAVVHAAARVTPWGTAAQYRRDNVDATRNVIEFCRRHGLPRLVYVSTTAVFYRAGHQLGLTEETPIGPRFINEYARSKRAGEELVAGYPGSWIVVRPRAVFGPEDTTLFPRLLAAAKRGTLPILANGGAPVISDLIYIDTLLDYLLTAVRRADLTGAYNLTNAEPVETQAFIADVLARLGLPAPRRVVPVRRAMLAAGAVEVAYRLLPFLGEPPITRFGVADLGWSKTFDVSKALRDLGPPSVPLADGVAAFVRWQRARA